MKLKHKFLKANNKGIYFDFSKGFRTKMFSGTFPLLLGVNKYNSKAHGILKMSGMLAKDYFDPYYTIRGSLCEYWAYEHLKEYYADKDLFPTLKRFDDIAFDAYPENRQLGGKPDIVMTEPLRIVHEVKSKDIARYENYEEDEAEIKQGEFYCALENTNKLVMVYVFPMEYVEQQLRGWLLNNDKDNFDPYKFTVANNLKMNSFKFLIKPKKVDLDAIKGNINDAYKTFLEAYNAGFIPQHLFHEDEFEKLTGITVLPF